MHLRLVLRDTVASHATRIWPVRRDRTIRMAGLVAVLAVPN